ncbi:transporter substrate-binding domain-containing protein [Acetobacterium wieringae]|uniref:Transporter substrate-binding domain-containing protein n=2 Tax=Acetobacterium wieringae TaxID=52694 RepID=A0A5D0WSJ1_9FIRM|nr:MULTISPECIES: transporter substrate-binding domain-containing protein [Acetobacterium]HAZ05252.1 adhesin [Acetobacterium sp.]MEA4804879.1 transporter substrate-binding domain-containing protein [Acetobacterium wieringae]OXS27601.1 MAG: adhesin [Acetobacterium sp. MES1]TYC87097.1 transporter substrate-binding domain-containing protein [Acetobacterium wieringae]URN86029.1 transporter substrate-binding domain-containing protein [Acetobacterium wieringae]
MTMKKVLSALLVLCLVFTLAACSSSTGSKDNATTDGSLDAVVKAGVLRVGVKEDVPNFGLRNTTTGEIEGFEIDLVKLLAKAILGDENAYELTPVTAKTRGPLLDNGEVDLVIATFTITDERKLTYNFSTPYYEDAVGLLVKKDAGFKGLADMNGKVIGVAQSATSKDAVQKVADEKGITVSFSEYATYPEIKAALDSGRVDAFCVDGSILGGYVDDTTMILPDRFSPQQYGVTSKLDNIALTEAVDGYINGWLEDGTIEGLITKWGLNY